MLRLASKLRTRRRDRTRGQSLVEFALVLPILMLLSLAALDFGRVYLGYINIQNMARIAANYAANNPDAWTGPADAKKLEKLASYQNQIAGDALATNCDLPTVGGKKTAPAPTFTDADADGTYEIGDSASVGLTCTFHVITPVMANIVGGTVQVSASAVFPVKASMTSSGPGGGGPGSAPVAAFTGNDIVAPSPVSGVAPLTVMFRDTSGGAPTAWSWAFPDDGTTSALQDTPHTFVNPGTYIVTLTASNYLGFSTATQSITVTAPDQVNFVGLPNGTITAGTTVIFTSTSSVGGTAFAWNFGAGQGTGTGAIATHTYNTAGSYNVTLTVTYPTGNQALTKPAYINVGVATCTVPQFNGEKRHDAAAIWAAANFTGTLTDAPGAPNGNYTINTQTLTWGAPVPCSSNIQVTRQ